MKAEMSGSEQRTELARIRARLANKRTFLAWCRTALAVMGAGVVLEKVGLFMAEKLTFEQINELGVMGIVALLAGPVMVAFAGWRYIVLAKELGDPPDYLFFIPELLLLILAVAFAFLTVWKV